MDKKVSIIIPFYNGKEFIKKTIASCYNQEYKNIEVIVVDDCSRTDELEYLESVANEFTSIKILYNKSNSGMIFTCNRGSEECTGDFLLFLGQDDILPSSYLYNSMKCFEEDSAFVYSIPYLINENGEILTDVLDMTPYKNKNKNINFYIGKENIVPSTGLIIKRDYFDRVGKYDIGYRNYGEWHLWIRLLREGKGTLCTTEHALYRRHSNNITNEFSGRENIDKQILLHKYWNECRELAARSFEYNLKEKIELFIYRKKILIITYIFDQYALIRRKFCIRK